MLKERVLDAPCMAAAMQTASCKRASLCCSRVYKVKNLLFKPAIWYNAASRWQPYACRYHVGFKADSVCQ